MGASARFLGRKRSVHEILGGGIVADVMLWRRRDATIGILFGAFAACVLFQVSGYRLMTLVSNVLLLLFSILFVWAKAASLLNRDPIVNSSTQVVGKFARTPPPVPDLNLPEEVANKASTFVRSCVNMLLSGFYKIALGKDTKLFYRVVSCLWLISLLAGFIDFLTMAYASLVILLTIPMLYEKYEDHIDRLFIMAYVDVQLGYESYEKCFDEVIMWIMEKKKQLS